jgi:endonuclease G
MENHIYIQRELRYGAPVCDEILFGRYFTIGYSWYFRQAKWTIEIINRKEYIPTKVERNNFFRADVRIPPRFRSGLINYKGSGYDRGHLVSSANQIKEEIQNSETFLLSNMSPQVPAFNQGIWADLEIAVRKLNDDKDILETYVLTSPIFYFDRQITTIGTKDVKLGIDIPVPHAFTKSVLAEDRRGRLMLWTFLMDNKKLDGKIEDYLAVTYDVEQLVGGVFWNRINGKDLHNDKKLPRKMWAY